MFQRENVKIRKAFVSNSSSSSYVVVGAEVDVLNYKVSKDTAKKIVEFLNEHNANVHWDGKSDVFVTSQIRDEQFYCLENFPRDKSFPYSRYSWDGDDNYITVKKDSYGNSVRIKKEHLSIDNLFLSEIEELSKKYGLKYSISIET